MSRLAACRGCDDAHCSGRRCKPYVVLKREAAGLADRRGTVEMPTISYDAESRRSSCDQVRRNNRWRSGQRSAGRSPPLGSLVIKTLSIVVFGERVDAGAGVKVGETWRHAARQQDAQSGHTHDCGTVGNQSADASPERPDKRHVRTPLQLEMILLAFWLAGKRNFSGSTCHYRFNSRSFP